MVNLQVLGPRRGLRQEGLSHEAGVEVPQRLPGQAGLSHEAGIGRALLGDPRRAPRSASLGQVLVREGLSHEAVPYERRASMRVDFL